MRGCSRQLIGTWLGFAAVVVVALVLLRKPTSAAPVNLSVDAGVSVRELLKWHRPGERWTGWVRVRVDSPNVRGEAELSQGALRELRRTGVKTFVNIQAGGMPWRNGVRGGASSGTLPLDLREAFARARRLAEQYGSTVDAWEIDNEPELAYIRELPETYAAYLKATYLGFKSASPHARVIMAPMALPPGPFLEALLDNGLLSYTDGFNFHYFGFAPDFPGLYAQFRDAIENSLAVADRDWLRERAKDKTFPVFVSEYGYGLLSGRAAGTVEGRVRQWEFFREMNFHLSASGIESAMAFVLRPYFEDEAREFGLALADRRGATSKARFQAGEFKFAPRDFGSSQVEPWMNLIGGRIGPARISPALAWLFAQPMCGQPRSWSAAAPPPSPVVLDFAAGNDMHASKSSRGHYLLGGQGEHATGEGELVVYNFGTSRIRGRMRVAGHAQSAIEQILELPPLSRITIPLRFDQAFQVFGSRRWSAAFEAEGMPEADQRIISWLYPPVNRFRGSVVLTLRHRDADSAGNAHCIDARPLATGEAPLHPAGRWRVTSGVSVHEEGSQWRFTVSSFPAEQMRPAIAELPLPDGFRFDRFNSLWGRLRLLPRAPTAVEPADEPRSEPEFSAIDREVMGIFVRTRDGGLYAPSMHFPVSTAGLSYVQFAANCTGMFYGRMAMPWRFLDNAPVSLVFMFRPRLLPAVYEVSNFRILELHRIANGIDAAGIDTRSGHTVSNLSLAP